jgi:hypothetical protein
MGNIDSRRRRKEQKERQQIKRQQQLAERRDAHLARSLLDLESQVSGCVSSGRAKVAICMLPDQTGLIVSMWDLVHPRVLTRRVVLRHDQALDPVQAEVVQRGIGIPEWLSFLGEFMSTCASAGPGQAAISMIQWRPGEGPPVDVGSTAAVPSGLPGREGMGH